MRWRGTLFEKEMRQNTSAIISMTVPLVLFFFLLWLMGLTGNRLSHPFILVFYWSAFAVTGSLGSTFLANENGDHSTNFLLRLPVPRWGMYRTKIVSHAVAIVLYCAAAFLILVVSAGYIGIIWETDPRWLPTDYCTALVWIPLMYFVSVCFSVVLSTDAAAFLAAAAFVAAGHATCQFGSALLVSTISASSYPRFDLIALVGICLEMFLVLGAAILSWRLFARKEGR
jgi:hypothetical protein